MIRLIKHITLSFLIVILFLASGGVNVYYHLCNHGHSKGIYSFTEPDCHCDIESSHCCCGKDFCNVKNNEGTSEDGGYCTNHHKFINLITDFIAEQEFNIPAPVFLDFERLLRSIIQTSNSEFSSEAEAPNPPDIKIRQTGRDLVCLIQNFRIGDCHIA